jgi:hypothetical protein
MTIAQLRGMFTRLLCNPPPTPRQIASEITAVLTRNEEARIYSWHAATGQFPPRLNHSGFG